MGKRCPNCDREWPKHAQFCGKCGAQLTIGPRRRQEAKGDSLLSHGPGAGVIWVLDLLPGITRPVVLVCAMIVFALAMVGLLVAAMIFQMGAMISAFAIGGGSMILYWSAVSWILYGYVCVPVEAMAEFQGKHWTAFFLATVVPGSLFLLLMGTLAERGGM